MQSNQSDFRKQGMIQAFVNISKEEGLKGLYRVLNIFSSVQDLFKLSRFYSKKGVVPNAQRAAIVNAAELSTYDSSKQFLIKRMSLPDNTTTHFMLKYNKLPNE